jgi:hypothetical protein
MSRKRKEMYDKKTVKILAAALTTMSEYLFMKVLVFNRTAAIIGRAVISISN